MVKRELGCSNCEQGCKVTHVCQAAAKESFSGARDDIPFKTDKKHTGRTDCREARLLQGQQLMNPFHYLINCSVVKYFM